MQYFSFQCLFEGHQNFFVFHIPFDGLPKGGVSFFSHQNMLNYIKYMCSLQSPRLPAQYPAYLLTGSNPCVELAFFSTVQNLKP